MPRIELVPFENYVATDPYHHLVDARPLDQLAERIFLVNNQVDINTSILRSAIGTQGTLANRLAQSINDDGTLITVAIDNALHNISEHLDGNGYVRMTLDERSKLSFIADNATNFVLVVDTISGIRTFSNETVSLEASDTITWRTSGSSLIADTAFSSTVMHIHHYGIVPTHEDTVFPDYQNYLTTSLGTPYQEGSLRVYINGVRLNTDHTVYVPIGAPTVTWTALMYSEGTATNGIVTGGDFSLSSAISASVSIIIDFDVQQ